MTSTTQTGSWRPHLVGLGIALVWVVVCYRQTALGMIEIWARSGTFTHAFLVPPISAWLIWRERKHLLRHTPCLCWPMVPLLALTAFAWLVGDAAQVNALTQLSFVAMLVLAVPLFIGVEAAKSIAFPLGFLFFAVPLGEFVMPRLMAWTADVTVLGLRLSGVPVYQEGLRFVIPSGSWSVIEACSGVRYLIASLVVGVLFAYLNYRSLARRLIFVAASLIVPIVANWARAYLIVMLGHISGNQLATGVDHLIYGWVFFGLIMTLMFVIGARWREAPQASKAETEELGSASPNRVPAVAGAVLVVLVLASAPLAFERILDRGISLATPTLAVDAMASIGAWKMQPASSGWEPAFAAPSATWQAEFSDGAGRAGLYIGYYRQQDYRRKLVSSSNVLVRSEDPAWARGSQRTREFEEGGRPLRIVSTHLNRLGKTGPGAGNGLVAWQWYWINGRQTASDPLAKAWLAWERLSGQGDDAAVVIYYAPDSSPGEGEAVLERFVPEAHPRVKALLERTRAAREEP